MKVTKLPFEEVKKWSRHDTNLRSKEINVYVSAFRSVSGASYSLFTTLAPIGYLFYNFLDHYTICFYKLAGIFTSEQNYASNASNHEWKQWSKYITKGVTDKEFFFNYVFAGCNGKLGHLYQSHGPYNEFRHTWMTIRSHVVPTEMEDAFIAYLQIQEQALSDSLLIPDYGFEWFDSYTRSQYSALYEQFAWGITPDNISDQFYALDVLNELDDIEHRAGLAFCSIGMLVSVNAKKGFQEDAFEALDKLVDQKIQFAKRSLRLKAIDSIVSTYVEDALRPNSHVVRCGETAKAECLKYIEQHRDILLRDPITLELTSYAATTPRW